MAIDYTLEIYDRTQALDHLAIREALVAAFSLQTEDNHIFFNPEDNLIVVVTPWLKQDSSSDHWETAERRAMGFRHAGTSIGFRHVGSDNEITRQMYRMVNWVLEHYPVDAQMWFNDPGNFTLFRSHGQLVLIGGDEDEWRYDPVLLTLITLPYEYRKASAPFNLTFFGANRKVNLMALANLLMVKFQLSVHPEYATKRIGEGLIVTPYRFQEKGPYCFVSPKEEGEYFGIHFEVDVLSYEAGLAKLVAITRWVLDQYAGDATLEWYPESMVHASLLTRTNNEITLSDEPDFWTPERKAIFLGKP